jgi:predicted DNA-binding transcriptional regulator YafY
MNRFDRITAILIQLQSKRVVKAQDLADRFGISLRTVYRDIRTLEEAGVPLYGEAGVGYSLVESYRLPPVMFTREEAMAFLTAEKLMEKFTDDVLGDHYASAMFKIRAVLRGTEQDLLENLDNNIIVNNTKRDNSPPANVLDILLKSIAEKKSINLVYRAFGNVQNSERLIEPIGIFHEYENWYSVAWCHLRNEYRQFRADRIVRVQLTSIPHSQATSLSTYYDFQKKQKSALNLQKAVIRVEKKVALYMQESRHRHGFVSEKIDRDFVEMTFLTQHIEDGLARYFMMFADYGEIVEPESLKICVSKLLDRMMQRNSLLKNIDI